VLPRFPTLSTLRRDGSSPRWRADVLANMKPEKPTDPDVIYQSGHFATSKHPDDE
jgi:hypothetical protein